MQNGNGRHDEKLDDALEDSFPASDPVSMTQPNARQGAPKQNSQSDSGKEALKDKLRAVEGTARNIGREVKRRIEPDYLWLGGAFVLGCVVGLAASNAPSAFARRGYGERLMDEGGRLQRRIAKRASDMRLQQKLSQLLDRLQ